MCVQNRYVNKCVKVDAVNVEPQPTTNQQPLLELRLRSPQPYYMANNWQLGHLINRRNNTVRDWRSQRMAHMLAMRALNESPEN